MPADAFRATEYLKVRSALEEVATLIEGADVELALQWRGGSVRRLRRTVEAILRERDLRATRN